MMMMNEYYITQALAGLSVRIAYQVLLPT